MLVSIMKDIKKDYPDCRLHILGDGDERAESEDLVKSMEFRTMWCSMAMFQERVC